MDEKKIRKKIMKTPQQQNANNFKPAAIWITVIIAALFFLNMQQAEDKNVAKLSYTEFKNAVINNNIKTFVIYENSVQATGRLSDSTRYKVNIHPADTSLHQMLYDKNVDVTVKKTNTFLSTMLYTVFPPVLLVFLLWFFIYRQMRGIGKGAMSFGKSKARKLSSEKDKVTFADVAGVEEAKEEVVEIVDFLKDPEKFKEVGGRIPTGILLMGSPGTGKTLLAKSIAGEADVPFFSISGSDFVEMFVGVGASRVRDMFEEGKKNAPCIIFVDEIDAVGRHRGTGIGGGHDEREQTLNALLVEMDGFNTSEGIIVIAATNRPDVLDPALLRPGRFDRQIVIDLPDIEGRLAILKVHSKKIKLDETVDLSIIARGTPGFSGADLASLINESALLAARSNKKLVSLADMEEARDKVKWGRERKSKIMSEEDKKITAYHEAGHALVLALVKGTEPLHKVTIIPRGIAYLGATMQLPVKDKYHQTKKELLAQITGMMGGRIAEDVTFNDITSGARGDIKTASSIARSMVCEWGMSELGPIAFGEREEHMFLGREISKSTDYSNETAMEIDRQVNKIIMTCYKDAERIIKENIDKLDAIANNLLEREVLEGSEIDILLEGKSLPPKKIVAAPEKEEENNKNDDDKTAPIKTEEAQIAEEKEKIKEAQIGIKKPLGETNADA